MKRDSAAVLLSVRPRWCEFIAHYGKTIEVRKTKPKIPTPFTCYIYCTRDKNGWLGCIDNETKRIGRMSPLNIETGKRLGIESVSGKVIGEFVCDQIIDIDWGIEEGVYFDAEWQDGFAPNGEGDNPTCLSFVELADYLTENEGFGWHISDLVIYDRPLELSEFYKECNGTASCRDCEWYFAGSIYEPPNCGCDGYKPITRPPQSWCYVEKRS